jgi:hypothetical protein
LNNIAPNPVIKKSNGVFCFIRLLIIARAVLFLLLNR